jgi:hypothetical protein
VLFLVDGASRTEDVFAAVFQTTLKLATDMQIHLDSEQATRDR